MHGHDMDMDMDTGSPAGCSRAAGWVERVQAGNTRGCGLSRQGCRPRLTHGHNMGVRAQDPIPSPSPSPNPSPNPSPSPKPNLLGRVRAQEVSNALLLVDALRRE